MEFVLLFFFFFFWSAGNWWALKTIQFVSVLFYNLIVSSIELSSNPLSKKQSKKVLLYTAQGFQLKLLVWDSFDCCNGLKSSSRIYHIIRNIRVLTSGY